MSLMLMCKCQGFLVMEIGLSIQRQAQRLLPLTSPCLSEPGKARSRRLSR